MLKKRKCFRLYWTDIINKSMVIEAKNEKEARAKFFGGNIDWGMAEEGDVDYLGDSLEIDEVTE